MENKPGTGAASPFGNGSGATSAAGGATGAHNFLTNPASGAPKTGGHDFTQDNRDQKAGTDDTVNPDSIAPDGKVLYADPPAGNDRTSPVGLPEGGRKPFTLRGV